MVNIRHCPHTVFNPLDRAIRQAYRALSVSGAAITAMRSKGNEVLAL